MAHGRAFVTLLLFACACSLATKVAADRTSCRPSATKPVVNIGATGRNAAADRRMYPCVAQAAEDESRLGLSCRKILAMKPEVWADYYNQKKPGGEAGYDQAYLTYAGCMKERNDATLAKLPRATAERLRKYRKLCGKFREDVTYLQQAYAGGGTMYTHAAARGEVEDEQLVERLARLYATPMNIGGGVAIGPTTDHIRKRIRARDPATALHRKQLAEFSTTEQGRTFFKATTQDLAGISTLLASERADARRLVVKFLDNASRGF